MGLQWGDEGKGKLVDALCEKVDYVVRYQGGANAGHTVVFNGKKFVFHLLPSGILHPKTKCVLANGMAIDTQELISEIERLESQGFSFKNRLFLSDRAHIVMPYHKILDQLSEKSNGVMKIGTTQRGIGPCYQDKVGRKGFRPCDVLQESSFKERLKQILDEKNKIIKALYSGNPLSFEETFKSVLNSVKKLKPYISDNVQMINDALDAGKSVLFEAAQGALLSVDFGTYPYVTSSSSDACGVPQGAGVAPYKVEKIIGVMKAYQTRVGEGQFTTELSGELGEKIRAKGQEFGATTGRPRRVGWLDLVSCNYAIQVNGVHEIALTKLDILTGLKELKVAVAYKYKGKTLNRFPTDIATYSECKPVYKTFKGWNQDISNVKKFKDLPPNAKSYVEFIEKETGVKVSMISVANEREKTILK